MSLIHLLSPLLTQLQTIQICFGIHTATNSFCRQQRWNLKQRCHIPCGPKREDLKYWGVGGRVLTIADYMSVTIYVLLYPHKNLSRAIEKIRKMNSEFK